MSLGLCGSEKKGWKKQTNFKKLSDILSKNTKSCHIVLWASFSGRRGNCKIPNIMGHFIADKSQTIVSNILNILTHCYAIHIPRLYK